LSATVQPAVYCGNGITEAGESCDDGKHCDNGTTACVSDKDCAGIGSGTCATRDGDRCPANCLIEYQAVTTLQAEYKAPESRPVYQAVTEYRAEYKPASLCGNGVVESGESCDDGNTANGDGCSSGCLLEYQALPIKQEAQVYQEKTTYTAAPLKQEYNLAVSPCGNGVTETDLGERCDDGNRIDGDGCSSKCQLEVKAVYGGPVPILEPVGTADVTPGKVYTPETPPDPCLAAGPAGSPEYQCCKSHLYAEATRATLATAGPSEEAKKAYECCVKSGGTIPAAPGFDVATCSYLKPECKVSGPTTVTKGDKAEFTVTDSAGLPFASFECKESPAPPAGTEAVAVLVNQTDYTSEVYSALATRDTTASLVYATRSAETPPPASQGVYATTADQDKTIACTITGPGGTSDPCTATFRVGECAFSCEPWKTSVGLDADCKLLKKPAGSLCSVSVNAAAAVPVADDGLVAVPTDDSGVQSFDVRCEGEGFKAQCGDRMEVAPVCEGLKVTINGVDGTGQTAREGDAIGVSVSSKGAKECAVLVNGQKTAAGTDGTVAFKVAGQGNIAVDAMCLGGTDLKGNSLVADCPDVTIPVASPQCGNNVLETGEICDDGNLDATDACVNCRPAKCGDGFGQKGVEECDFGAKNDDLGADCTKKCRLPVCGDGFLQKGIGEECDDGNLGVDDGCSSACAIEKCGDGIRQSKEACDPGLKYEGQACKADCLGFEEAPPPPPEEESPPEIMKREESPPSVTAIPWVAEKKETASFAVVSEQPKSAVSLYEEAPGIDLYRAPTQAPLANEIPPPPAAEDPCLKDYPDVNSQGYKCCKEYKPKRGLIINRSSTEGTRPLTNYFECCMAPENTDGVLDRSERMACECKSRPDEPFCNCLGTHQADFLNGCLAANGSPDKFAFKPDPPSYVYEMGDIDSKPSKRPISMPACACASPQKFSAPEGACGILSDNEDLRVHDYPCLYPEQVDVMKKAGIVVETVPEGYRVTLPISPERCAALGGSAISMNPPSIEADASSRFNTVANETQPAEEDVLCTFVKPACPCTPPPETQPEPETEPEEPPPPPVAPETPEAKTEPLKFRMAISSWGDFHAVLLDTGEEIALKEATPELPRLAITSEAAYKLYNAVSAYNKKPNAENLAKLRTVVNENLLGEVKDVPHYGLMLLTPPPKDREDEGATATAADFAAVRAQFAKKAIELNASDGTLKVNTPEALQVFRPSGAAALEVESGPEIVSMSQLFKTLAAEGQPPIIEMTVDAAVAAGGGEGFGCSLVR
jgi:cysteine-rich repeat protein